MSRKDFFEENKCKALFETKKEPLKNNKKDNQLKIWIDYIDTMSKKNKISIVLKKMALKIGKELIKNGSELPKLSTAGSTLNFTYDEEKIRFSYFEFFPEEDEIEELDLYFTEINDPTCVHNIVFPLDGDDTIAKQIANLIQIEREKYRIRTV